MKVVQSKYSFSFNTEKFVPVVLTLSAVATSVVLYYKYCKNNDIKCLIFKENVVVEGEENSEGNSEENSVKDKQEIKQE